MKRRIAFLLAFILLLNSVSYTKIEASGNEYQNKNSWYESSGLQEFFTDSLYNAEIKQGAIAISTNGKPFPLYIVRNGSKYYLNYRIFKQKNLYVYGNYASVSDNYFKCGYQIHEDLTKLQPTLYYGNGYFLKPANVTCKGASQNPDTHGDSCKKHSNGTVRGEWKYLGFDISGNKFSNMWMINVATETKFTERNWQAEPWEEPLKSKTGLTSGASEYNTIAYGNDRIPKPVSNGVRKWISATFDKMPGYKGIPTKNSEYPSGFSYDAYKFMYVQSPPTLYQAGSGRMWHLSRNNVLWYQTFSIPKLPKKDYLPVDCTVAKTSLPTKLPSGSGVDNKPVTLEFEVSGILRDDVDEETGKAPDGWIPYYKDAGGRTVKYTRYDLASWDFTLSIESLGIQNAKPQEPIRHPSKQTNTAKTKIQVETTIGKLKGLPKDSNGKYTLIVTATAKPTYTDKTKNGLGNGNNRFTLDELPAPPPTTIEIPTIKINNHIGEIAFDGVSFDDASDSTDMSAVSSTELYMNGQPIDYDTFFSRRYTFPSTTDKNGYFAEMTCVYNLDKSKIVLEGLTDEQKEKIMSDAPLRYVSTDYVYVYPTRPIAQFKLSSNSWKQNRIINIENTSDSGNIALVLAKYPIAKYEWSYGDGDKPQLGTDTDLRKQLQYKESGTYTITLKCQNTLGKWSDPYTVEFEVLEDIAPNIELNLTDNILTRNDQISAWHYDVSSTDGDKVASATIELWYDSDNNGFVDTLVQSWNGLGEFPSFTPSNLGYYKYCVYAKEEFEGVTGQESLADKISDADKKSARLECDFWVDNYQPLSDIYIDAPIERPNVDLYIMRDKDLAQDKYSYIAENRVAMENSLLGRNMIPNVNIWDMKTYEYSTPANTSKNTGTSYPAAEISYSSAGYSGTLQRSSVMDNGGYQDFGHYESKQESKTASAGGQSVSGHGPSSSSPPDTVYYSDGAGYSGYLRGYGYNYTSVALSEKAGDYDWTRSYAGYSGTVYRTVQVWVPNMQWVSNYTGYYAGNIYKYVRQPYTNIWRENSVKYLLYISDNNISELSDFNAAASKSDAKIILAGSPDIKSQYSNYGTFIDITGKSIQEVMDEAMDYIAEQTPSIEQIYLLQNQQFTLNVGEDDLENDEIVLRQMQYVHDKDFFDNPTGQEPKTQTAYNDDSGWTVDIKNSFSNVGKYQIFRRVKDKPSGVYGDDYSYYSGATEVDIYIHRRPIALATLDWTYDPSIKACRTIWIDKSYDLDHNITRAKTDKGIVDRKIMFRKDSGEWQYYIPDSLTYGTYDVLYWVKDMEGAWSDPWEYHFTLDNNPQFTALARARDAEFSLNSIPASEYIEAYNLWTRQSNPVSLDFDLTPNVSSLPKTKTVSFQEGVTGKKSGQDITWYNQTLQIPDIFPDGPRTFKVTARDTVTGAITPKTFSVNVFTPINLRPTIRSNTVATNSVNTINATTTKYPETPTVQMQYGTAYQSSVLDMTDILQGDSKSWTVKYNPSVNIPEGTYTAKFISTNPSGKNEVKYVNYQVVSLTITGEITPSIVMAGEKINITCNTTGYAEEVEVTLWNNYSLMLTPDLPTSTHDNIWRGTYIVPLKTKDGPYEDNVAVARRSSRTASTKMDFRVKGSILQLIKPSIKESN